MIRYHPRMQAFECDRCGAMEEVTRETLADQELYMDQRQQLEQVHTDCNIRVRVTVHGEMIALAIPDCWQNEAVLERER